MRSSRDRRERAAVGSLLLLIAWWLLYAGLPLLISAGFDDGRLVICEGASAALMSVLYPKIKARAVQENADIFWADETGSNNCEIVERGWSPKGRPPVLPVETRRERANMISSIS